LIAVAGTNTKIVAIKQSVLNIGGSIASLGFGMISGFIGGLSGFVRGLWNSPDLLDDSWLGFTTGGPSGFVRGLLNSPDLLDNSWLGFATGCFLGGAIGFRGPKKLIKDPLFRQMKFSLDNLDEAYIRETIDGFDMAFYEQKAYEALLNQFDNDKDQLDDYLNNDAVEYEIATYNAEFLSPKLAGSVGHHIFIRIPINGTFYGLESTTSPSDFTKASVQSEKRTVSGRKLLEMIACHMILEKTHTINKKYIVTKLKPGERDCFSYINTLLIGTSQKPTILSRLHATDNLIGKTMGFFIKNLSAYPDNLEFNEQTCRV
jgi:hypothetical protein